MFPCVAHFHMRGGEPEPGSEEARAEEPSAENFPSLRLAPARSWQIATRQKVPPDAHRESRYHVRATHRRRRNSCPLECRRCKSETSCRHAPAPHATTNRLAQQGTEARQKGKFCACKSGEASSRRNAAMLFQ